MSDYWPDVNWSRFIQVTFRHLASIAVAVGIMWGVVRPHAAEFVKGQLNERITRIEEKLSAVVAEQSAASNSQARIETDINQIKSLQQQTLRALLSRDRRPQQ